MPIQAQHPLRTEDGGAILVSAATAAEGHALLHDLDDYFAGQRMAGRGGLDLQVRIQALLSKPRTATGAY